jgi:hypothetical protein
MPIDLQRMGLLNRSWEETVGGRGIVLGCEIFAKNFSGEQGKNTKGLLCVANKQFKNFDVEQRN